LSTITLPGFPNHYPFNDLLLDGKLIAKTRTRNRKYRGPMLLHTATRAAKGVARVHGYDLKDHPKGMIVGVGVLSDVHELNDDEWRTLFCQFNNVSYAKGRKMALSGKWICEPFYIGYFFTHLRRFSKPIPFKPPRGAVSAFSVPVEGRLVTELRKAGYRVGRNGVTVRNPSRKGV